MSKSSIPHHIKSAILTHRSRQYLEHAARRCLDALCTADKFGVVVRMVDQLLALVVDPPIEWTALQDYALIQCASERCHTITVQHLCLFNGKCDVYLV